MSIKPEAIIFLQTLANKEINNDDLEKLLYFKEEDLMGSLHLIEDTNKELAYKLSDKLNDIREKRETEYENGEIVFTGGKYAGSIYEYIPGEEEEIFWDIQSILDKLAI